MGKGLYLRQSLTMPWGFGGVSFGLAGIEKLVETLIKVVAKEGPCITHIHSCMSKYSVTSRMLPSPLGLFNRG